MRGDTVGMAMAPGAPLVARSHGSASAYAGFAALAVLALVIIIVGHVALDRGWLDLDRPTAFLLRGFTAATALGIGLVNVARYRGRRDAASLIVGTAFTGMGVLYVARTAVHVLAVLIDPVLFETTFRLGWAHRMILPVGLLLGITLVPQGLVGAGARWRTRGFVAAVALLAIAGFVGAWFPAFPGGAIEGAVVARPSAGALVAAYVVLLVLMWRRSDLTGTPEGRWLAFALYVGFLASALVLPFWHTAGVAAAILDALVSLFMLLVAGTGTLFGMVRQARDEVAVVEALRREAAERSRVEAALARQAARLEQTNEELSQYAYLASHDLQEPLRMVTNYLQLIDRRYADVLDEDGREFMHFAVDGAVRMRRLTNDLLAYSQVSSQDLIPSASDADAALAIARKNLEVAIAESGAMVTSDPLPTVPMDAVRLVQLFQNLIANALKFAREGVKPIVHVSAAREGDVWRFSVSDNGIGIDPIYHDKVFGVFQRLNRRDAYPGSGIGLAICRKIVERHGGSMWITVPAGGGAAFHWTVPAEAGGGAPSAASDPEDDELSRRVTTLIDRAKELM